MSDPTNNGKPNGAAAEKDDDADLATELFDGLGDIEVQLAGDEDEVQVDDAGKGAGKGEGAETVELAPVVAAVPDPRDELIQQLLNNQNSMRQELETMKAGGANNVETQRLADAHRIAVAEQTTKLQAARTKLKTAVEGGDTTAQIEANEELADAKLELRLLGTAPPKPPAPVQRQQDQPTSYPKAGYWTNKNAGWFHKPGYEAETAAAYVIDKVIKSRGFDPNTDAYYDEMSKELKKRMPALGVVGLTAAPPPTVVDTGKGAGKGTGKPQPGAVAASAAAPSTNASGKRIVKLTRRDESNMIDAGLNPRNPLHAKRWAAEKLRAERSDANQSQL